MISYYTQEGAPSFTGYQSIYFAQVKANGSQGESQIWDKLQEDQSYFEATSLYVEVACRTKYE